MAAAGGAGDPWITALPGAYGPGTAGEILGDWKNAGRLDLLLDAIPTTMVGTDNAATSAKQDTMETTLGAIPTTAMRGTENAATAIALATVDTEVGNIQTDVTAIKAKTDPMQFTATNYLQSSVQYVVATQLQGAGVLGNEWGPV